MASTTPVGCRLPNGIRLRVFEPTKNAFGEPMLKEIGEIVLAGNGQHTGKPDLPSVLDGAVYTDVDADLWAKWREANKDSDLFTSGAVFEKGKEPKLEEEGEDAPLPNSGIDTGETIKAPEGSDETTDEAEGRASQKRSSRAAKASS